ncbi:MAG: tRNA pseudouridine(55) synthase TruB [Lachnospiraceae bacterium]|nr:tRNA pseudouridine(55) synthase TruB [Lachnospiraceae bacterium]
MKEKGYTSNDVVAKLRGILRMKKIGHTGTLDPQAEGVLPICLGKATKIAGYLTDTDKTYRCVMRLGLRSDTEDMTGKVTAVSDCRGISFEEITDAILSFKGEYDQIPPMYSAKKINGRKLYELAREGIEIERRPSRVNIKDIYDIASLKSETYDDTAVADVDGKADGDGYPGVQFTVECSKGTYIRSLCRDIGEKLGCGAVMESLIRIRACGIDIGDCLTLSEIERIVREGNDTDGIENRIFPIDRFYEDCSRIQVSGRTEIMVRNGNKFKAGTTLSGRYRVYFEDGTFAAIYDIEKGEARLCRLFL